MFLLVSIQQNFQICGDSFDLCFGSNLRRAIRSMFRLKRSSTDRVEVKENTSSSDGGVAVDWEVRPGGLLVQKREEVSSPFGPLIKVRVSFGSSQHEVTVPAHSTVGDLKSALIPKTGLQPQEQRVLFRGKEKEDQEYLHMVGVKHTSKVILFEDPACKERKLEELMKNKNKGISDSKAYEAVSAVREQVNRLCGKISALESHICCGTEVVADREFAVLSELLMMQLLKLDTIEAEGQDKLQRKTEVCRIQSLFNTIDSLKMKNFKP